MVAVNIDLLKVNFFFVHKLKLIIMIDSVFGRCDDFAVGMYLVHVVLVLRSEPKYKRITNFLENILVNLAITIVSLLGYFYIGIEVIQAVFDGKYSTNFYPLINNLVSVFLVLFMVGQLFATGYFSKILRFLCSNYIAQLFGIMCYSFYMWSNTFIFREILDNKLWEYFAVVTALSVLSYRYIEFGAEPSWKKLFYDFPK